MERITTWGDKPYHSFDYEMKNRFGRKVYKLSFDGGMTCPNRDGSISTGGCIFCSAGGSGEFATKVYGGRIIDSTKLETTIPVESSERHLREAIIRAKALVESKLNNNRNLTTTHDKNSKILRPAPGYIAYFQSFSNTYASLKYLRKLFAPFTKMDDILAISIATRPDCLPEEVIALLSDLNSVKPIWVELGLQTIHEDTARFINRGYPLTVYDDAVKRLRTVGIEVITHVILGLPGETREMMLDTVKYVSNADIQGIKLQLLHILKNTKLAELYEQSLIPLTENKSSSDASEKIFHIMEMEEYLDLVTDCVSIIPPEIVIHRLTGDGFKRDLIAPKWSGDKKRVLNTLSKKFKDTGIYQGCNLH